MRSRDDDVVDARQLAESGGIDGTRELEFDGPAGSSLDGGQRLDRDESSLANDPHPVCGSIDLRETVRGQEHRGPGVDSFAQELMQAMLHQRVESAARFIENDQLWRVGECLDQRHLLPVPGRHLDHAP